MVPSLVSPTRERNHKWLHNPCPLGVQQGDRSRSDCTNLAFLGGGQNAPKKLGILSITRWGDQVNPPLQMGHQNSIAFSKAPRRKANNQPTNQSITAAVSSQLGRQTGRQKHTETHSLAFFSGGLSYKQWGVYTTQQRSSGNTVGQQMV